MATTNEDIIIRAGMDQAGLARGLQTMRGQVQEFATTGKMGFLKARDGAEAFQTTISKLTSNVPILGTALHAMLSPVGAVLTGATLAFTYFTDKIAKWNEELDAMGEKNAKAIGNVRDSARQAADELAAHAAEFREWQRSHSDEAKEYSNQLKEQLADMRSMHTINSKLLDQEKEKALAKARQEGRDTAPIEQLYARRQHSLDLGAAKQQYKAISQTQGTLSKMANEALDEVHGRERVFNSRSVAVKDAPDLIAATKEARDQQKQRVDAATKKMDSLQDPGAVGMGAYGPYASRTADEAAQRRAEVAKELEAEREKLQNLNKLLERQKESLSSLTTAQKDAARDLNNAKGRYDSLFGAEASAREQMGEAGRRVNELAKTAPQGKAPLEWLTPAQAKDRARSAKLGKPMDDWLKDRESKRQGFMHRGLVAWNNATEKEATPDEKLALELKGLKDQLIRFGIKIQLPDE